MLCLSGFELYSRWVPLKCAATAVSSPLVAKHFNKIAMIASYSTALLGFVDQRTKYISFIVLLFGSMSIKEHLLHVDSPDIDFSLIEHKKNSKKFSSLNPKTCLNPVIMDQFSFLLHCQY